MDAFFARGRVLIAASAYLAVSIGLVPPVQAQSPPPEGTGSTTAARVRPSAAATRVSAGPTLDGRIDDTAWANAPVITGFTQRDPNEGQPVSEATTVRIVYTSEAIYIGARLEDSGAVTTRLGRRDMNMSASDWFSVSLDTHHDRRNAVRFDVNPDGVRRDATVGGGGFAGGGGGGGAGGGGGGDSAWDAVWGAATSVDERGWTVEMRIPFNQLRFPSADDLTWGLQLERIISRKQETAWYAFSMKSEPAGVAAYGDLTGLRGIRPGRPLELVPYLLSNANTYEAGSNPFRTGRDFGANAGLDARFRLSSSMVLAATANPDFGQVEVDPAIINLSAFETRLDERRPFFVEGATNFRFGSVQGPGGGAASLLYSRRIGRPPQLGLGSNADVPGVTDILGAVKITGRTASGLTVGVLNAVTNTEHGRFINSVGGVERGLVEPGANYFVGRVNQEFRRGMSSVGVMATNVARDLDTDAARAALRSSANSAGLDFVHEWANRVWSLTGFFSTSRITGDARAITAAERSSSRYFQRPDSDRLALTPTATSMSGYATTVQVRKSSGIHWTGDFWVGAVSPGYEINDMGFLQRVDRLATGGAIRYAERQPGRIFRNWSTGIVQNHTQNYDGDWIEKILRPSASATLWNYWELSYQGSFERERIDDRLTRGGPLALKPRSWTSFVGVDSDPRKTIGADFRISMSGDAAGSQSRGIDFGVSLRTSPQWSLSLGPEFTTRKVDAQYVTSISDALATSTYGARYIFAPLEQTEVSLVTRFNYTFTPDLTLELYLQPLVSNGQYGAPKEFLRPSSYDFSTYGADAGTISKDGTRYTIDPDGQGPASSFGVNDRSFTTRSLRGSAVVRYEYRPGSTLFLVWQSQQETDDVMADFGVGRAFGRLLDGPGRSAFVVKWSYRFNP